MPGFHFLADPQDVPGVPPARCGHNEEDVSSFREEAGEAAALVLPWMTSFLVHLGIAIIALFIAWAVITDTPDDAPIVPAITQSDAESGAPLSETPPTDDIQVPRAIRELPSKEIPTDPSIDPVAWGVGDVPKLVGQPGGGKIKDPFGSTKGQSSGLGSAVFPVGNVRKVIFCVDASGSMIRDMPFVIRELKDSIQSLNEKQEFTVIFFQDGEPIEPAPKGWKPADSEHKTSVLNWIAHERGNLVSGGKTDPVRAIQVAMRYKPELLFILSDNITGRGRYEVDEVDLLQFLAESNRPDSRGELRTKINTIQFLYPDPLDTLRDIAEQHGGVYRFVTEKDLGMNAQADPVP